MNKHETVLLIRTIYQHLLYEMSVAFTVIYLGTYNAYTQVVVYSSVSAHSSTSVV